MKLRLSLLLLLTLILVACDNASPPTSTFTRPQVGGKLTVFAAASLKEAFTQIGSDFAATQPGSQVAFSFAGSQQLATQLGQGAPADVFASASGSQMAAAIKSGRVVSGTQQTFTRNRLIIILPRDNPAAVKQIADLARPGLQLVLADSSVPAGQYARQFLAKASSDPALGADFQRKVLANVLSNEQDVKAVYTKVSSGEAQAGIVYVSDAVAGGAGKVAQVEIADRYNVVASYPIAAVSDSKQASLAQAFIAYTLSPAGQAVLQKYGFAANK